MQNRTPRRITQRRTSGRSGKTFQLQSRDYVGIGIIIVIVVFIIGRCTVRPTEVQVPFVVPITVIATNTPKPTLTATATSTVTPKPTRTPTLTPTVTPSATSVVVTTDTFTITIPDSEIPDDLIVTLGDDEEELPMEEPVLVNNDSRYWVRFDRYNWVQGEAIELVRYDIAPGTSMVIPTRGNHATYAPLTAEPTKIPELRG
ncbi:MAG: hypothetical protein ACEQSA_02610 [Weeksellaceae bacterium]